MWIWDECVFLKVYISVFHLIWKVFEYDFFKCSSLLLFCLLYAWHPHYAYVGMFDGVP